MNSRRRAELLGQTALGHHVLRGEQQAGFAWSPEEHPRNPPGSPDGGRFASDGGNAGSNSASNSGSNSGGQADGPKDAAPDWSHEYDPPADEAEPPRLAAEHLPALRAYITENVQPQYRDIVMQAAERQAGMTYDEQERHLAPIEKRAKKVKEKDPDYLSVIAESVAGAMIRGTNNKIDGERKAAEGKAWRDRIAHVRRGVFDPAATDPKQKEYGDAFRRLRTYLLGGGEFKHNNMVRGRVQILNQHSFRFDEATGTAERRQSSRSTKYDVMHPHEVIELAGALPAEFFDPNQPRAPKGTPEGGRFASVGSSETPITATSATAPAPTARSSTEYLLPPRNDIIFVPADRPPSDAEVGQAHSRLASVIRSLAATAHGVADAGVAVSTAVPFLIAQIDDDTRGDAEYEADRLTRQFGPTGAHLILAAAAGAAAAAGLAVHAVDQLSGNPGLSIPGQVVAGWLRYSETGRELTLAPAVALASLAVKTAQLGRHAVHATGTGLMDAVSGLESRYDALIGRARRSGVLRGKPGAALFSVPLAVEPPLPTVAVIQHEANRIVARLFDRIAANVAPHATAFGLPPRDSIAI